MSSFRTIRAVSAKEARELVRDPVTVFVALLAPLALLFIFGYALNVDVREVAVAVIDRDGSPESREYASRLDRTTEFRVVLTGVSENRPERLLDEGSVRVVIVIPSGFARRLSRGEGMEMQTLVDGSFSATAQVVTGYLEAFNQSFLVEQVGTLEPQEALPRLRVEVRVWYNPSLASVTSIVPGLIGVILMAFPPLLTALAVVREEERGSIRLIRVSPARPSAYITGKLVPYALLAFLNMLLILAVGLSWFRIPLRGSPLFLLAASVLYVFATVGVGLFVSTVARTQVVAVLMVLVLTVMPSFMFSGFMYPIFAMPQALRAYTYLFPGRYFVELSRGVFLKGAGFDLLYVNMLLLALYAGVMVAVASLRLARRPG